MCFVTREPVNILTSRSTDGDGGSSEIRRFKNIFFFFERKKKYKLLGFRADDDGETAAAARRSLTILNLKFGRLDNGRARARLCRSFPGAVRRGGRPVHSVAPTGFAREIDNRRALCRPSYAAAAAPLPLRSPRYCITIILRYYYYY
uniref:Uncharacterized protein n=1 Tax=Schizaphis graminum TaxID=13262 RepID=A0A2S2NSS1_SCHGA